MKAGNKVGEKAPVEEHRISEGGLQSPPGLAAVCDGLTGTSWEWKPFCHLSLCVCCRRVGAVIVLFVSMLAFLVKCHSREERGFLPFQGLRGLRAGVYLNGLIILRFWCSLCHVPSPLS